MFTYVIHLLHNNNYYVNAFIHDALVSEIEIALNIIVLTALNGLIVPK